MVKYFCGSFFVYLILLAFCLSASDSNKFAFQCSPEIVHSLCSNSKDLLVCALNNQGQYLTFRSPCQACKNQDILGYNQGSCACPDVPCPLQQICLKNSCLQISKFNLNQLAQLAYQFLSSQNNQQALKILKKALQITEGDSNLYYLASLAAFSNDQPKESLKYIKKAILLDPEVPQFYLIRGRAFSQINKFDEAQKQFQRVIRLKFDDVGLVHFYQAQNLLKYKKNEEAIKKFESALKYHPQKSEWYVRKALAHLINKEQKMALLTCREGLKFHPNNQQIKLFMSQFNNIDQGKQMDLERLQQKNLFPSNQKSEIDPYSLKKIIQQRKQEQEMQFERQRLTQKMSKQQRKKQQYAKKTNQELQL